CVARYLDDPEDRVAPGALVVQPAALRGGFPLQPGAAARECRERRLLRRGTPRTRRLPGPLLLDPEELVAGDPPPQAADLVHHRLSADRDRVPVPGRGAALFC